MVHITERGFFMNKSKIKSLMWWSVISLAILIFISVSLSQEFPIALLSVLFYCALPTLFISLATAELNKGDVKTIEEFDAQEELNQHIKEIKKTKRQNWWKDNESKIALFIMIAIILIPILAYIIYELSC
jgi:cell shape-determining protein MreC